MQIKDVVDKIFSVAEVGQNTCDTYKSGSGENTVTKVAVSMFATVDVIKAAHEWGAELLIVHEPTFYEHMDNFFHSPASDGKKALIDQTGITIVRYHDHMHAHVPDMITKGMIDKLELHGEIELTRFGASYTMTPKEVLTGLELGKRIEEKLNIKHVRICGERNKPLKRLALCFGTPGGVFDLLGEDGIDAVLVGECCEWILGEWARDAAALGLNKTLFIMGHCGSERYGMEAVANWLKTEIPEVETRYFECGEVYTYTD